MGKKKCSCTTFCDHFIIFCYREGSRVARIRVLSFYYVFVDMQLVFSSSATVYGQPDKIPCDEDFQLQAMNPYGRTKVYLSMYTTNLSYTPNSYPLWVKYTYIYILLTSKSSICL